RESSSLARPFLSPTRFSIAQMFHRCSHLSSHESRASEPHQRPVRRRMSASHREGVVPLRERRHLRSARALVFVRTKGMERQAAGGAQADAVPAMLLCEEKEDAGDARTNFRGSHAAIADAGHYRVETATAAAALTYG